MAILLGSKHMLEQESFPAQPPQEGGETSPERQEKKNIFLEIGTGHQPLASVTKRKFEGDDYYVGIDLPRRTTIFGGTQEIKLETNKLRSRKAGKNGHVSFFYASGEHIPYADEAVVEVYVSNLFGDPSIDQETTDAVTDEAYRVLKTGGKFTIRETNTPADPNAVMRSVQAAGFEIIRIVQASDRDWESFSDKYHPANQLFDDARSYYLVAVKKKRTK